MPPETPFDSKDFATLTRDLLQSLATATGAPLTDDSEGSVVRTLAEAFARELAICYQQLRKVYQHGFLDTAEGVALDNVVALLGMSRQRAYQVLYNRTGVEELRALTSALNQSTKLGLSIARILRGQADFLRTKLAQKAEEKSAKLPIYMAFPLWFCVMPALMVILLAPSIITFMQNAPTSISSGVGSGL